ncbi:phospholipase A [Vibrio sp. CAU 1672]|uniref:phospholipase A n=1 Tax=Vibrio sp. CAU 1672 TaxID=3032594 RepID=UPI0023DB13F0|nr:phospholipase A [Vibrio sp. CAU 1672]MDF2152366.1 phospholipase A [Vibrio sp. CAU 1672]
MKYKAIPFLLCPVLAYGKSLTHIATYEDNYVLGTYTSDVNQSEYDKLGSEMDSLQHFEVKFQLSAAVPFYRFNPATAVMGSYTQKSLWQLANSGISSPFRETNYKPQLFVAHQSNMLLFNHVEAGYKHESNGQSSTLSRSWDRLYVAAERFEGPVEYGVHAWWVISTENKEMKDYFAPYELWAKVHIRAGVINTRGFYNFATDKGGVELGYTFYFNELLGVYIQGYHGYGETLIDYNHSHTRIGVGIRLMNL